MMEPPPEDMPPITELSSRQRRVLGVLLEKAFTTPDAYPLTLKALTTGCNQKSNRDPLTNYSEDDVTDVLDELRELGLIGTVHTESGRTERYRHYMRKRFDLTEPQLAILTELMLRGAQKLGELRTRASRMQSIDSQEMLRKELRGLQELGYLQADGGLERRGTTVDHGLYRQRENQVLAGAVRVESSGSHAEPATPTQPTAVPAAGNAPVTSAPASLPARVVTSEPVSAVSDSQFRELQASLQTVQAENRELRERMDLLDTKLAELRAAFADLRAALGG